MAITTLYTFKHYNTMIKMVPSQDPIISKLKKLVGSFLLQRVAYGGEEIFGPSPKLNRVEFSEGS